MVTKFLGDKAKTLTARVLLLKYSSSGILINSIPLFFNIFFKSKGNYFAHTIAKS